MSEDKPFEGPQKIKLTTGEEIELPRLTIGKIMAVTGAMTTLIRTAKEKSPEVFDLFTGTGDNVGVKFVQVIPELLPALFDQIVNVLSIYLGKPKEWIVETMDMEDLAAVAVPFFGGITKQANHILGPINGLLQKAKVNPEESPS